MMKLNTIEINGTTLYRVQDLLSYEGLSGKKAAKKVCNWKVATGANPMSVQGRNGGTYLTEGELESFKEYINPIGKRVYAAKEHGALCAIE